MMRWFRRRAHRPTQAEYDDVAEVAEQRADEMMRDATETAERLEPTLRELESRRSRNAIYESVLATLRGTG